MRQAHLWYGNFDSSKLNLRQRKINDTYFSDMEQAAEYLCHHKGNVLLTTGSKDLKYFTHVNDFKNRVYVRMLLVEQSIQTALDAGYAKNRLICEKGSFSQQRKRWALCFWSCISQCSYKKQPYHMIL